MNENRINKTKNDYKGKPSTLCKGCGHDSITNGIVSAYFELGVQPHMVMKLSGIGCSSKTPTYFLEQSHGFNGVHGRMPSLATGANLAQNQMSVIGVSGDGDSMSIGLGQFCHTIRRNVNMVYIIENNGTYGLTKGQFSATADKGSPSKRGVPNPYPVIDVCETAVSLGATFVARTFSGDRKQMIEILKAAHAHKGIAIVDILSPCVTFNNHDSSTKSYTYVKDHDMPIHELGFIPFFQEIEVEIKEGEEKDIELHDGSRITLKKLGNDYDPMDKSAALAAINRCREEGQHMTGLIYFQKDQQSFDEIKNLSPTPLRDLSFEELDPGAEAIAKINASLK